MSIDDLSEHLQEEKKYLAVQGKNIAIHREEFYSMNQHEGPPVQQFLAKLQS